MSMTRKLTAIVATLMMTLAVYAQAPQVLGDSHAMKRVKVSSKYLLLPVQEKVENANVRVLVDNQQMQSFNVKLAVDKVDYFVPLDLGRLKSKDVLLDITFHGDRRATGRNMDG